MPTPSDRLNAPSPRRYHLLRDCGLYKQTLLAHMRARFWGGPGEADGADARQIWALLHERRQWYTLDELELLAGVVMTAHDDCILDWPEGRPAVQIWTAQRNSQEHDRVQALLRRLREQEQPSRGEHCR